MKPSDIDNWFNHHAPSTPGVIEAHVQARAAAKEFAHFVNDLLPVQDAEKILALRSIKDALARVNESIALNQVEYDADEMARKEFLRSTASDDDGE